jgi:hypothetical protein
MKSFLNVFREFNEIDLRNSRFGYKHDPVRFDAADRGVFVKPSASAIDADSAARIAGAVCQCFTVMDSVSFALHTAMTK